MTMIVQKANMMTLILTKDRDFKLRAVNFLNNIAFSAEKITIEKMEEIVHTLESTPRLSNFVVDGTAIRNINKYFPDLIKMCNRPNLMVLMYLPEEDMKNFAHQNHGQANILCRVLPFNKHDFNEAFHSRQGGKTSTKPTGLGSPAAQGFLGTLQHVDPNAKKKAEAPKSISAFEASGHLKTTIDMMNELAKDRTNMEMLNDIGQRFNGVIGAFVFLGNKKGVQQLVNLSDMIDDISRTYMREDSPKEMSQVHFDLMMNCAKCSFRILQVMRENKDAPDELIRLEAALKKQFDGSDDILKKEKHSQDDVDALMQEAIKEAE